MNQQNVYIPEQDPYFAKPYIDVEEWRDSPIRHYYVHGGFEGTDINGSNEARFCFYFPEADRYRGRFFQYLSPAPEDERESEHLTGEDDKISFCISHGAYYVVSNQGGFVLGDMTGRLYKTSANAAEFSRKIAKKLYNTEKRPYGYVFGGSGGSFKTMGCMEATDGVWDGAVPYVMANPMAAPNVFAPRMRAVRLLGEEGIEKVVAALEPGGSGDMYAGLNEEQQYALSEATAMGFPPRAWFAHSFMGDGALMVLVPTVYAMFPTYFKDFWEKEGYEGSDPNSNEARSRMQHITSVAEIFYEDDMKNGDEFTSVDNSWINTMLGGEKLPKIRIADTVPADKYQYHCRFRVLSGAAAGAEMNIDRVDGEWITLHPENGGAENKNPFKLLQAGDRVMIDNSDAIAMQCFHRHQLPDLTYPVYDQFRDSEGNPVYAQLPMLVAPMIAISGAGLPLTGNMHGKMIGLCSMLDESACPWHGDWYRKAIARAGIDENDCFRLYYHDNSIHDDRTVLNDPQHQVDYLGTLHQALLDVADWCEKGIEPFPTMSYTVADGQVSLPESAGERGGMQPVVHASVSAENGETWDRAKAIRVKCGESVTFRAVVELAEGAGEVTRASWDYERTNDWSMGELLQKQEDGTVLVETTHTFHTPGTYFPCIKVQSNRHGDLLDIFTQCKNLDRVRVEAI